MSFWESSSFWSIFSIIASTIIAIVIAIYSKGRKTLVYSIDSIPLIDKKKNGIPDHTIIVDGHPTEHLFLTTVWFENKGNQMIEPSDFSKSQPLCISVTDCFFYPKEGYKVKEKNLDSRISIKKLDEKRINIEFEDIRKKEQFSIQLLHEGNLSVSGDMRGGNLKLSSEESSMILLAIFFVACTALLTAFNIIVLIGYLPKDKIRDILFLNMYVIFLWCLASNLLSHSIVSLYKSRKSKKKHTK